MAILKEGIKIVIIIVLTIIIAWMWERRRRNVHPCRDCGRILRRGYDQLIT